MEALGIFIFLFIAGVIVAAVLSLRWAAEARETDSVQVARSPQEVAQVVHKCFPGLVWKDVPGRGDINKQRRSSNDSGPVISIDFDSDGSTTNIDVWMSEWTNILFMPNFAGAAVRMKRKVLSTVANAG